MTGYVRLCYRSGDCLELPSGSFDEVCELLAEGRSWWRCETVSGLECLVDLRQVDTVIAVTAEIAALEDRNG